MNYTPNQMDLYHFCQLGNLNQIMKFTKFTERDKYGWTPLHTACYYGHLHIVKFLLTQGVNINTKDNLGCTPLHRAVQSGHLTLIQFLLINGANPNLQNHNGNTALHWALQWGYIKIIEVLRKDTNLHLANLEGKTPFTIIKDNNFIAYNEIDELTD
jgi:ankyrin repeat protein